MSGKIVLAGASGVIGRQVAAHLADHDLHVVTRRHLDDLGPKIAQHVAKPTEWAEVAATICADIAISCIGSTMKKSNGNKAAFHLVDVGIVMAFAEGAQKGGAEHFISVSSVGASPHSGSFYLRTKAEAEQGLRDLGFKRLDVLRPGLLTGAARTESRAGESIAIMLSPFTDLLMMGPLRKYASTPSAKVAQAIAALTSASGTGHFIHENDSINALAG